MLVAIWSVDDAFAEIFELPAMDSVYTELSEHLDGSVKMKKAMRTRTRNNNALVMIVKRQFSAYLIVQESFKRPELHNVVFHPWYVSYLWD